MPKSFNCPNCGNKILDCDTKCKYCGFDKISTYLLNIERNKDIVKRQYEINERIERDYRINKGIERKMDNKPKCPTCGSLNVEKISTGKKVFGGAMFGLFSSDVRNTMHCKNCGYKW